MPCASHDAREDARHPGCIADERLQRLVRAICDQENGQAASIAYVTDADIEQGVNLALGAAP
jgi:hypothetical protein